MAFGRKVTFGKKKATFQEVKQAMQPTPDDDGVTRVFPKELWDDPKIGGFLKEMGFEADDAKNVLPTAQDYQAKFAEAQDRLKASMDAFNADMTQRHGYCQARPFLVIDSTIWDGPDGAFLYAQLDLMGYDDWNVIMLAGDPQTKEVQLASGGRVGYGRLIWSAGGDARRLSCPGQRLAVGYGHQRGAL